MVHLFNEGKVNVSFCVIAFFLLNHINNWNKARHRIKAAYQTLSFALLVLVRYTEVIFYVCRNGLLKKFVCAKEA